MIDLKLGLANLVAWSVQVGLLGAGAALLFRVLPIERPAAQLAFSQALLASALVLPFVQPWSPVPASATVWSLVGDTSSVAPASASAGSARTFPVGVPSMLAALLILGVAIMLLRLVLGLIRLGSLRGRARPFVAPPWLRALRDEVAPRARFVSSAEVVSPASYGVLSPVVLLPPAFASLGYEEQRAVALHELFHVRRWDWLAQLIEEVVKAGLFFHPTVHWLVGRVRLAREQTVDAAVVERLGDRRACLDSLVTMGRLATRGPTIPAAAFLRESHLRERVDLLLRGLSMTRTRCFAHLTLSALALALLATLTAAAAPLRSAAGGDEPAPPARIVSLVGNVQIKRAAAVDWARAVRDQALQSGDLVRTHEDARATLRFANGSRIDMHPGSLLEISGDATRVKVGGLEGTFEATEHHETVPSPGVEPDSPGVDPPRLVHQVQPTYPPDAQREGVEGLVRLRAVIDEEGTVRDAWVVSSAPTDRPLGTGMEGAGARNGDPRLEKAALAAVRQWRFRPATTRDGRPVEVEVTELVSFRIY